MPELRTRSAGAKVTEKEYAEIEKLAEARGLNVGEWCREVILKAMAETGAEVPSAETILGEILGLRMLYLNTIQIIGAGRELTTEDMRKLIAKVDGEKQRRVAEVIEEQAARKKKPARAESSSNGKPKE
jgi:hypothetical protein